MPQWQRHVRLNPEWYQCQTGDITIQQLAAAVAKKLRAMPAFDGDDADLNDELEEIIDQFEGLAGDKDASVPEFDCVMDDLYNWADQRLDDKFNGKKVCWVDTMTPTYAGSAVGA